MARRTGAQAFVPWIATLVAVALAIAALFIMPASFHGVYGAIAIVLLGWAVFAQLQNKRRRAADIDTLRVAIDRFAACDFDQLTPELRVAELSNLSHALDRMATRLDHRFRIEAEERSERLAIIESMAEGVVAVDRQERIISLNQAAAKLLNVEFGAVQGLPLIEVVRNAELESLARDALESDVPLQREIKLHQDESRDVEVKGAVLRDTKGRSMGAVLVLNDVTRLRHLERIRRDFVSNVSHELRTPLTTIKGFVETLQESAMESPEDAKRFLGLVAKHVNRLNAIIEDLTSLSRIEQGEDKDKLTFRACNLRAIIDNAVQVCDAAAVRNEIQVRIDCSEELTVRANAALLEQCIVNLLDNAIKYSPAGREVSVGARLNDGDIAVTVSDEGIGIAKEHLERIFERFYRVDKGRSRAAGGTGLGLSIVRHIVHLHGGQIEVESRAGGGSTFRVTVAAAPRPAAIAASVEE